MLRLGTTLGQERTLSLKNKCVVSCRREETNAGMLAMNAQELLREISDYCRQTGLAESTFGRRAVNDGKLTARLRQLAGRPESAGSSTTSVRSVSCRDC